VAVGTENLTPSIRRKIMAIYASGARIASRYEVVQGPHEKPSLQGGMGLVYICLDHQEDRPVALKTFKPEFLPDHDARDRFLREGTAWVELGVHPHVVRCYEVVYVGDGTEVYLILELIAKEQGYPDASLRSWLISGRPLPVETALLFALQIARGMQHAVESIPGFVHRDLKPENVLVGADRLSGWSVNRLRITDFGLAGVLQSFSASSASATSNEQPVTRTQLTQGIVGTPLYMAPEQWTGGEVGVYTDVYALGCILYELLVGQPVVEGCSLRIVRDAHCMGDLRPLPEWVSTEMRELITRCLSHNPVSRYVHWDEVEDALAKVYTHVKGVKAPSPSTASMQARADRIAKGESYSALGLSYLDIGKLEVAMRYFEQALQIGNTEEEKYLVTGALSNIANTHLRLGNVMQAIRDSEQCLVLHRELDDRRGEGYVLGNLGFAYLRLGKFQRAIEFLEQSYAALHETRDRQEAKCLNNLGDAYRQFGNSKQAIVYLERALNASREIGDRREEGNVLGNLGSVYGDLGDAQRAIKYYEQYLSIAREIGNRSAEGNALGNLGSAYLSLGKEQCAIDHYEQALVILDEVGDMVNVASFSFNMAVLLSQQGDTERALFFAQKSLQIWARVGSPHTQQAQQLVAQLQGLRGGGGAYASNVVQEAFEAFQHADSSLAMQRAVTQFPLMSNPDFIAAVERVIAQQTSQNIRSALKQRLAWLRQIISGESSPESKSSPGLLGRLFGKK
jgi:tetratricopeptide (TPR) repeat protein